jgi:hypothetical protein
VKRLFRTALEIKPSDHVKMQVAFNATPTTPSQTVNLRQAPP